MEYLLPPRLAKAQQGSLSYQRKSFSQYDYVTFQVAVAAFFKKKEYRSENEKSVISHVLSSLREFTSMRQKPSFQEYTDRDYWPLLGEFFECTRVRQGCVITHCGDNVNKVSILLRGEAAVFLPRAEPIVCCEQKNNEEEGAEPSNPLLPNNIKGIGNKSFFPTAIQGTIDNYGDENKSSRRDLESPVEGERVDFQDWKEFIKNCENPELRKYTEEWYDLLQSGHLKQIETFLFFTERPEKYNPGGNTITYKYRGYIQSGKVIGNAQALSGGTCSATLIATEDCWLAEIKRDKLELFYTGKLLQDRKNKEVLKNVFNLNPDILNKVSKIFKSVLYRRKDTIYSHGSPVDYIYVIKAGRVEVTIELI